MDLSTISSTSKNKLIFKSLANLVTLSKRFILVKYVFVPSLLSQNENNLNKNQKKIKVSSFEDLIELTSKKKEIQLKYDLEKNVNLIKFSEGKIDISFNQNLDKNFVRNLSTKLVEWTGTRWVITLSKEMGKRTFFETQNINKEKLLNKEKEGEVYKNIKKIFFDAELLEVKKKD